MLKKVMEYGRTHWSDFWYRVKNIAIRKVFAFSCSGRHSADKLGVQYKFFWRPGSRSAGKLEVEWPLWKGTEEYVNLDSASASVRSLPAKNPPNFPKTTAFSKQKSQSLCQAMKVKENRKFYEVFLNDRLHSLSRSCSSLFKVVCQINPSHFD